MDRWAVPPAVSHGPAGEVSVDAQAQPPAGAVGIELRRRRIELGLTLRAVSARAGISYSFLSQMERGRRTPSLQTYERLRSCLSIEQNAAAAAGLAEFDATREAFLRRLAACLLSTRDTSVEQLAATIGVRESEVWHALGAVSDRLHAVGLQVVTQRDRIQVRGPATSVSSRAEPADVGGNRRRGHRTGRSWEQPIAFSQPTLASPVLIGREAELAVLLDAISAPPAVAIIEGEAGIGKSRLAAEMLDDRRLSGFRTMVGHCHALREPFPFGPVLEAFHGLDDLPDARVFSPVVGALRPFLPELGEHLPAALEPLGDITAERHLLFRAVRAFMGRLGPMVCVLEDVHNADEGTRELLRFLAADLPSNVSLVVTGRREDLADSPAIHDLVPRLGSRVRGAEVSLVPLSVEEVRRLVGALLNAGEVSDTVATHLHQRTAGIPFAVEEVVRLLNDRRDLVSRDGNWVRRSLEELEVPRTIRDSVLARVALLGPEGRRVVESASVLGVAATATDLVKVAGLGMSQGSRGLRNCLDAGALLASDDGRYSLRHPLAAQAVYEAIPEQDRRAQHLRAARLLEAAPTKPVAQLARHFRLAKLDGPRSRYAEAAADLASSRGDHSSAARFLHELLSELPLQMSDRVRLALELSAAALLGHVYQKQALAMLRSVVELRSLTVGARGHIRSRIGLLLIELGDASGGHRELARSVPELSRRPATSALVMVNLAMPTVIEGSERDHRGWLARAQDAARRQHSHGVVLTAEAATALVPLYFGDPAGWELSRDLLGGQYQGEEERQLLWLCAHLVGASFHLGHDARARSFLADADGYAERLGWGRLRPIRETAVLVLDWASGDWDGLEARALRLADEHAVDYPAGTLIGQAVAGSLALSRGDLATADGRLQRCCDAAEGSGLVAWLVSACGSLTRSRLESGRPDRAVAAAQRGLEVIASKGLWGWAGELAPVAVEALLADSREQDAHALVDQLAAGLQGRDAPLSSASLHLCRGLLAEARGQRAEAADWYARARAAYDAIGRSYAAAGAAARLGLCLLSAGMPEGAAHVVDALSCFEAVGAVADVGRARRALRQHGVPVARRGGRRSYGQELSPREAEVFELATQGRTTAEISAYLAIAPRTVEHHLTAANRKLAPHSRNRSVPPPDSVRFQ